MIITSTAIAELVGYDNLDRIAPTVAIDGLDWRRSYLETARVFGKEQEAAERLDGYDEAVAEAERDLGAQGRTVTVATLYVGDSLAFWIDGPINVPQVLIDLGFTLDPGSDDLDGTGGRAYVSMEQLDRAVGEDLIMVQSPDVEGEDAAYEQLTRSALWKTLPAVQEERVLVVDRLGYPGTAGRIALVELFAEALAD